MAPGSTGACATLRRMAQAIVIGVFAGRDGSPSSNASASDTARAPARQFQMPRRVQP